MVYNFWLIELEIVDDCWLLCDLPMDVLGEKRVLIWRISVLSNDIISDVLIGCLGFIKYVFQWFDFVW
jgi:hypothetical protein